MPEFEDNLPTITLFTLDWTQEFDGVFFYISATAAFGTLQYTMVIVLLLTGAIRAPVF